eukprot:2719198-Amphidinium_carterae.1
MATYKQQDILQLFTSVIQGNISYYEKIILGDVVVMEQTAALLQRDWPVTVIDLTQNKFKLN